MSQTNTVQDLYAEFGRGDVTAILNRLSDDVDWDNSRVASRECPWNGNFQGKSEVPDFFKAVGDSLEFSVFNPHGFLETGNQVAVLLRIESTLKKNGRPLKNDAVHVWTFNPQGQVASYRHYNDTAMELEAWRA